MSQWTVNPPKKLLEVPPGMSYLYESEFEPKGLSCFMGLAVGLCDCFLKQPVDSGENQRLLEIIKTSFLESEFSALPRDEAQATTDRLCTREFLLYARSIFTPKSSLFSHLAYQTFMIAAASFPLIDAKLISQEPLTLRDFSQLFEGIAMIWSVRICLFSQNSVIGEYGTANEIGPIALSKGEGNRISLLHDQEIYDLITQQPLSFEAQESARLPPSARMQRTNLSREQRLHREELTSSSNCKNCHQSVRGEPSRQCCGHVVCNSCNLKAFVFGTRKCAVSGCTTRLRADEVEQFAVSAIEKYGVPRLPLGEFTCSRCGQVQLWDNKLDCRCSICTDCPCACGHISAPACSLCFFPVVDPFQTPCGHLFCRSCAWTLFYHSNKCYVCKKECVLREVLPMPTDALKTVQSGESLDRTELLQALAAAILNSNLNYSVLHRLIQSYVETNAVKNRFVDTVHRYTQAAKQVAMQTCTHQSDITIRCNCNKRHCLSCLFKAKKVAEETAVPQFCLCGCPLDDEHQDKLRKLQRLLELT